MAARLGHDGFSAIGLLSPYFRLLDLFMMVNLHLILGLLKPRSSIGS